MSRFFAEGSDSDSDSSASEVDNEVQVENQGGNRFEFESSSSEEEKRVVRSARDKRYADMTNKINEIKHHLKDVEWAKVNKDFDDLKKLLAKAKSIVAREGVPKMYIKAYLAIKEAHATTVKNQKDEAKQVKMNASDARAMNGLKQKFRKHDKLYKAQIEAYLKDPLISEEEKESDSDSDSDSDSSSDSDAPKERKVSVQKASSDDSGDDDSEDWDSDSDGSGSDIDDVEDMPAGGIQYTRAYWMKKPEDIAKSKDKKARQIQRQKERRERKERERSSKTVKKVVEKKEEKVYTPEMVIKKLRELLSMRGKRGTNSKTMIADLELLSKKATDPAALLKVKVALASAYFEINLNKGTHMKIESWMKCYNVLVDMIKSLGANPSVRLAEDEDVEENFDEGEDEGFGISGMIHGETKKSKRKEKEQEDEKDSEFQYVNGNFYSFLYRLNVEFTKSLQNIDSQSPDYVTRLMDEPKLAALCDMGAAYYAGIGKKDTEAQVMLIHLELLYYHHYAEYDVLSGAEIKDAKKSDVVEKCSFLYTHGNTRQRTRALLAQVYFYAHHNLYTMARDLLLMSHVKDNIDDADIRTRILFNRVMAQLGLCAFRTGHYGIGMQCLADLYQSTRIKELLAQGISSSRFHERDVKQEKVEKKRQYPFHMHLNFDMLESVHLVGAMFTEVENICTGKRRVVSKIFRREYDKHTNNFFNAPPENTRDLIMHATKNIRSGYWKPANASIMSLSMWAFIPYCEHVKATMTNAIKELSLRMYLKNFGSSYVSVALSELTDKFELSESTVYRVTSKMMVNGILDSVWDQPTKTLIMHSTQPSRLQKSALKYADKVIVFVEQNEHLLNQRAGNQYQGNRNDGKRWNNRGKGGYKGSYRSNR